VGFDVEIQDDPDPAVVTWLEERVTAATARATGHDDERPLAVLARDGRALVGGVCGWTWGGCCELQYLWVDEGHRGQGLGTALLDAAEAEAARRGCELVVLLTHAVSTGADGQRYTRRGYELVGRVDDYPRGDAALWYRKRLPGAGES
jgi:GNAT superfamily N-acetyltransferase